MDFSLNVLMGNIAENSEENSEDISSVALLSSAGFDVLLL